METKNYIYSVEDIVKAKIIQNILFTMYFRINNTNFEIWKIC